MGQFSKVLLATGKVHSTTKGAGLQARLKWVKPGLLAQPSHRSLTGEYHFKEQFQYKWKFFMTSPHF